MARLKFKLRLVVTLLLLCVCEDASLTESRSADLGERMIPTVTGLDFEKVQLFIDSRPEFTDRFYARAISQLTKAGLLKGDRSKKALEKSATLMLTLDPRPLDGACPSKVMYVKKLELWEKVYPARNEGISMPAVTWSYGLDIPVITDNVSLDQLEADLDRFLFEFIRAYKMGNPGKQ